MHLLIEASRPSASTILVVLSVSPAPNSANLGEVGGESLSVGGRCNIMRRLEAGQSPLHSSQAVLSAGRVLGLDVIRFGPLFSILICFAQFCNIWPVAVE